jgi:hypothetical protein
MNRLFIAKVSSRAHRSYRNAAHGGHKQRIAATSATNKKRVSSHGNLARWMRIPYQVSRNTCFFVNLSGTFAV